MTVAASSEHYKLIVQDGVSLTQEGQKVAKECLSFAEKQLLMERHANILLTACKMALLEMNGYEQQMQQNIFETKHLLSHVIAKAEGNQ